MSAEWPTSLGDDAVGRLREAIAVLEAIDHGELLDNLPPGRDARAKHQCGVSLLAVLRRDLTALAGDLEAACLVQDVMVRVRNPKPHD